MKKKIFLIIILFSVVCLITIYNVFFQKTNFLFKEGYNFKRKSLNNSPIRYSILKRGGWDYGGIGELDAEFYGEEFFNENNLNYLNMYNQFPVVYDQLN